MDDHQLVDAVLGGDTEAFGKLAEAHHRMLVLAAYQMTGQAEDAEDLAQDALLAAYQHLRSLQDRSKFRPWLFAILRNKCQTHQQRRRPTVSLEAVADTLPAPPPPETGQVAAWLQALPRPDREAIAGRYLAGMSYAEIAHLQGTTTDVVGVRLHRAKKRLRRIIQHSDDEAQLSATVVRVLGTVCVVSSSSLFAQRVLAEVQTMGMHTLAHPSVSALNPGHHALSFSGWKTAAGFLTGWKIAAGLVGVLAVTGLTVTLLGKPAGGHAVGALLSAVANILPTADGEHTPTIDPAVFNATHYTPGMTLGAEAGPGELQAPAAVATDDAGNIYVADCVSKCVVKYASDGRFLTQWGSAEEGDTALTSPEGIAISPNNSVYVTDTDFRKVAVSVKKYTADGQFIAKITLPPTDQPSDAQFLAFASDGTLYVSSFSAPPYMRVFSPAGKFLTQWKIGELNPRGLLTRLATFT